MNQSPVSYRVFFGWLAWLVAAGYLFLACRPQAREEAPAGQPGRTVKLGVEVFLETRLDLVKGKKIGLITNPSGVDGRLRSVIDLFRAAEGVELVALYGPEHGVRGNAQAGEHVPFYFDDKYGLPVFSLYGQSSKPAPGMLKDIDRYMRSFDTTGAGKIPENAMIKDVDTLVFDIQDVGTRVYTYIATMAYALRAAAESGIDFIVLDRPNPINGKDMEGPVLEYPEHSSFVGIYPIPERHGMTVGELARMFNDKFLEKKANLTVIPMEGWRREGWLDETGLPWVIPSPNMPTLDTATVYPGQVLFEGTNVSEGRGTTRPFELFGAPWIDGYALAGRLNKLELGGVWFREAWFTPAFSKFTGEICGGAQVHVIDRNIYRPFEAALHIIKTIREMYPEKFEFHPEYFDKVAGTAKIRGAIESGVGIDNIVSGYEPGLTTFAAQRRPYLLY
jgi:beta-N-acetylhexosaminidase